MEIFQGPEILSSVESQHNLPPHPDDQSRNAVINVAALDEDAGQEGPHQEGIGTGV